jgi:hypothetical protein
MKKSYKLLPGEKLVSQMTSRQKKALIGSKVSVKFVLSDNSVIGPFDGVFNNSILK